MFRKRKILSALLLICFVIYSASPLSFSFQTVKTDGISTTESNLYAKNCNLLLLELLLDSFSLKCDADNFLPDEADGTILIKKKRMILSTADPLIKSIQICKYVKISDIPVALEKIAYYPVTRDNKINLHEGFHPLYSGTSPPAV